MNSDDEYDIARPEKLPVYRKGREIFDMVKNCRFDPGEQRISYGHKRLDVI